MATWAKGVNFRNKDNTKNIGGIGIYGNGTTAEKLYIGLGSEPWNNAGIQLTSSNINFKGNKIYHAGDKPTPADIGAAASSHTHNYISLSGTTSITGALRSNSEFQTTSQNAFRAVNGNYGFFIRNDGSNTWFMLTNSGDQYGSYNSLRPISINNSTGLVSFGNGLKGTLDGNASTATTLQNARTIALSGDASGSASFNGGANITIDTTTRKVCLVGSDAEKSNGWYKVASQTMSGYGDTNITFAVTSTYSNYSTGILQLQIRSDNTSISCKRLVWHSRIGFSTSNYIVNINGMSWTLYAYQTNERYGRIMFEVLSQSSINEKKSSFTLYNSISKETSNPSATVTSSDGSTVATANTLTNSRTITVGNTGKSFNGSSNISWSLSEIGAAASSHSHSYLPLSGGTMTGSVASSLTTGTHIDGNKGKAIINSTASGSSYNMLAKMNSTNGVWTMGSWGTNFNLFYTTKSLIDAGNNSFTKQVTLLNESGNSSFPGTVSASSFSGSLNGNASTATKIQNARTINGTSFDGTSNITTSNWGTARTITIGNREKSVNVSGNISWSLSEIGAAASSHSHSYLPTSGGTMTGDIIVNNFISYKSKDTSGKIINLAKINTNNQIALGDTAHPTFIFSAGNPKYCPNASSAYAFYHENYKPTPKDIGAVAFDYSGENANNAHPRIYVPGREWLRAPSGGFVPYENEQGYLGLANKRWYDMHTKHMNSRPMEGFPGHWWDSMGVILKDGVMEIGRVIDFHDSNGDAGDYTYRLQANGGTLYHSGSLGQLSDASLKENIMYIDERPMLLTVKTEQNNSTPFKDFIENFKFATFNYIEDSNKDINFGFIAQDIADSEIGQLMLREYNKNSIDKSSREYNKKKNNDTEISGTEDFKEKNNVLAFDIASYISIVARALQEEIKSKDLIIKDLENRIKIIESKI